MLSGCGSSGGGAKAGPILVAGASGSTAASSMTVTQAGTLKLSMLPVGDKIGAGVDWSVTCFGNPVSGATGNGACGTLSPAHSADGGTVVYTAPSVIPIGTTITITAAVTGNPSQTSSVSITVVATPIAVSISNAAGTMPISLQVDTSTVFQVVVTNDTQGAGVIWTATCGSNACGSFNPTQSATGSNTVYTAPSAVPTGGTVTITATSLTDTTKSASATVTITAPSTTSNAVTVSVLPASLYAQTVGSAHIGHFTAIVTGDSTQAGVDWTVSCGASSCGSITAHTASGATANFSAPSTVPPSGAVTVTAASTASPATSATAVANIVTAAPIVVTLSSPPPATLTTGSTATLAATVAHDPSKLGVVWTASCGTAGACGSFNLSPAQTASGGQILYTAPSAVPAGSMVTITASSPATTPANSALAQTTIVAQAPSVSITQQPPSALTATTQAPVSATVANDVAPGGVAWTVQCGSTVPGGCGYLSPAQTASGAAAVYTAPPATAPGSSVTLTATSVANPSASAVTNAIAINPDTTLQVSFIPSLPAQMQPNTPVNLIASVANDTSNAGVDWQVCASGCGFFTVRPAVAAIPATQTTPYVPPVAAVTETSVSGWSNGLPIPYTAPAQEPNGGPVAVLAAAHADPSVAASGAIFIPDNAVGPAFHGRVQAGSQPVAGAAVALYAAGTSGYASQSSQVAATTTDKNGNFTVPAEYSCPSLTSQMYLVATGGTVGSNTAANPNLALMTVLGSCGGLGSAPVTINEVTSIASAAATASFAANDALNGNISYLYLGANSNNLSGITTAFAAVNNLVDISTGQARYVTPAGNAAVPYVEINTLADILDACAATSGGVEGDGSACGTLFTATDVLPLSSHIPNTIAPTDTLQAAFNLAQHPVSNYGYTLEQNGVKLLPLVTPVSPFQPTLSAEPNDWSVSLHYTGGGGLSATSKVGSFAVDAGGDVWTTDTAAGSVIEWNGLGAAVSPATGFPAGGGPIALDANGNVWISGDGKLTELTSLGAPAPGSPFKGVSGGGVDMAFDAQSNLWIANGAGVSEFNNLGIAVSPVGGFTFNNVTAVGAIGVDSANNVWIGDQNSQDTALGYYAELTNPGGQAIVNGPGGLGDGLILPELAADNAGNLWSSTSNGICEVTPYGGLNSFFQPTCYSSVDQSGNLLLENPGGTALDGAGTVWVASQGGGSSPAVISPSILPVSPSLFSGGFPNFLAAPSLSAGTLRVAVDESGNVWVLLADNTITEYLGVAAPVVAPIALGVEEKKLATKP